MFDGSDFTEVARKQRPAAIGAFAETVQAVEYFDLKIAAGVAGADLSDRSERFLKRMRAGPKLDRGFPLSSRSVRLAASAAMIETTLHFAKEHPALRSGYGRLRMITVCPDVGLVDIRGSDLPMQRAKDTMRRALQGKQLDGLGMLDLALFSPGRGFPEDRAHVHSHYAVSYGGRGETPNKDWVRLLAPGSGNKNALGGPIVYISKQDPELTPARVAGLGWYISKESCGANTIYEAEEGQKSECSFTDWTFAGALRQLEFWSYVNALDACWSTGDLGAEMRTYWRKRFFSLLDIDELPRGGQVDVQATHKGWQRVWRELDAGFKAIDPASMFATRAPRKFQRDEGDEW